MAFSNSSTTKVGVKGSDVYTANGVEDPRVALSVLLVQGCDVATVEEGANKILNTANKQMMEDLFVLLFQTRDVRGGKGIRDASLALEKHLLHDPVTRKKMLVMLELIPEYGSWRDLKVLAKQSMGSYLPHEEEVRERILELFKKQLETDAACQDDAKLSLAAKYAPRECHKNAEENALAKKLASLMFPSEEKMSGKLRAYRKMVSGINKRIDTTEVKMCGGHFAEIEPRKVAGRCLQKNTKAFLNQESTYKTPAKPRPSTDPDRIACAEHFTQHFEKAAKGEAKVNGSKTVFPHELIKKIVENMNPHRYCHQEYNYETGEEHAVYSSKLDVNEQNAIVAVWNQMVNDAKEGGGLGRSLAMCDFSGSMQSSGSNGDTPYWVSMALGLLISEVTTKEFKDTFLTFDSTPTFHTLPKGDIFERVFSIGDHMAQGTSTDFQKAMDLVLARLKKERCRPGEEPENLIVITDMNWDQACGSSEASVWTGSLYRNHVKTAPWQTHVEMIRESFKRAGEDMWGSDSGGWKMPTIVIWNVAATSSDFHAKADTPGVMMLSGWSPSLFKVLQTEGVVSWTPYQALRAQLDDPRYDPVRALYKATPL